MSTTVVSKCHKIAADEIMEEASPSPHEKTTTGYISAVPTWPGGVGKINIRLIKQLAKAPWSHVIGTPNAFMMKQ